MTATKMAALVQYGRGRGEVELRELPGPAVGEDELLLRVGAAGVCGSDVHQYLASPSWRVDVPVVLGHEFSGTVAATGRRVTAFREGDRVVSETAARICGQCVYCRSGQYNLCPRRRGFGTVVNGAMAEYVAVPARCAHHIPDELPFSRAALTEPVCVAYNAVVERSMLKPGETVLILGPGPIGLLCLAVARLHGAGRIIIAGLTADGPRLALGKMLGATDAVDLQSDDLMSVLAGIDDGFGAALVVDAAGVAASFRTAMEAVRPLGQITKVGWGPEPLEASLDPVVAKAVTVNGSFSHTYRTWERVISLLASGQIDAGPLVDLEVPLARWKDGFEGMHEGRITKAVLQP